jgi:site-specific DNA recombinase
MKTKETLYIYTRVSTTKQSEKGYSLAAQRKQGEDKAKSLGMKSEVFEEKGVSAASESLKDRIQLNKIFEKCDKGIVKHLFVTEWDRLTRNESTALVIKKILIDYKIVLHTLNQTIDFANQDDELISDLFTILARHENRLRVTRSKRGRLEAVKKGKWHGGLLPYGYKTDENKMLVVDDDEAEVYREMVKLCFEGKGSNSIARILTEQGIKTRGAKKFKKGINLRDRFTKETYFKDKKDITWKAGTVLKILKNPLYKGLRIYINNQFTAPAIIDEKLWEKIQDQLQINKIKSQRNNNKYFYLLRGLMKCNRCDKNIYGLTKENKGMKLYCCKSNRADPIRKHCGMKNININKIEKLVWDAVFDVLRNSKFAKGQYKNLFNKKPDIKKLKSKITSLNRQIKSKLQERKKIISLYIKDSISNQDLDDLSNEINSKVKELENEIIFIEQEIQIGERKSEYSWLYISEEKLNNLFQNSTNEKKKKIIDTLVKRVYVDYLDECKDHVVTIEMRLPLLHKSKNSLDFLLNDGYINDGLNDGLIVTTPRQKQYGEDF